MRHRKASVKFNRTNSHKDAMFRNMVTSLFKYDRIRTTDAKAKELSKWADHLITLAKKGDLHSRRQALSIVRENVVVHQLFEDANKKYGERQGGYTRIVKLGRRAGDAATMSLIELIGNAEQKEKKPKKKKAAPVKKTEAKEAKTVEEKQPETDEKEKAEVKTKKTAAPKKKKAAKKKTAPKKKTAEKKEKKTAAKAKQEKETKKDKGVKKAKAAPKKKTAKAKKKAAPKKAAKKIKAKKDK